MDHTARVITGAAIFGACTLVYNYTLQVFAVLLYLVIVYIIGLGAEKVYNWWRKRHGNQKDQVE